MPRADVLPAPRPFALALTMVLAVLASSGAWAADPKQAVTALDQKAFFQPELSITSAHLALEDALARHPNRAAWDQFLAGSRAGFVNASDVKIWIDPRSGVATNIMGAYPLIPGNGLGNTLTLQRLGRDLRRPALRADEELVEAAVRRFIRGHVALLGIEPAQLGAARVSQINPELWQVYIPQVYQGVPVRHGHLVASISHGNLVTIGADTWGNVSGLSLTPEVPAEAALQAGFGFAEGPGPEDVLLQPARLEVIPFSPEAGAYAGPIGQGYGHRLVWAFVFQRPPEDARWEVMVDAHSGEVIALQDTNHYVERQVTGGVYPISSTEVCPTPLKCGTMQPNYPMPFANTGLAAPNNFTNSAGIFQWTSGTVTTSLSGRYVRVADTCGAASASSSTGNISLGGTNGQHDCTTPGSGGAGNTAASRSAFYEVNKIEEMARGYLPNNTWLTGSSVLVANVNINQTCNGFWNGSTINFYRSGGGCRNTGELAGVFDHEWGHGMDDNDANGSHQQLGRGLRRHRGHLPLPGLLRRTRLLPAARRLLRPHRRRHRAQHRRGPDLGRALRHRLLGCARRRLRQTFGRRARHRAQPRLPALPHRNRPLRPAGALRGRAAAAGGLGPGGARPAQRPLQLRQPDGVHHRQQAVLPGQRQHRHLVRLHLRVVLQWLRLHQRLHAVDHGRRRQRQPQRRHAAHDGHLRRLQPPRDRLLHSHCRAQRVRQRAQRSGVRPDGHPRQLLGGAVLVGGLGSHPLLGVPHRRPCRLQLRQGAHRHRHRHQLHRHPGGQRAHLLLQRGAGGRLFGLLRPGGDLRQRHAGRHGHAGLQRQLARPAPA